MTRYERGVEEVFFKILDRCYIFLDKFVEEKITERNILAAIFANLAIFLLAIIVTIADRITPLLDLLLLAFWMLFYPLAIDYYSSQKDRR